METPKEKVKTTLNLDKTLKKFAQMYALQHEMTLQDVVDEALRKFLMRA